jgi:hypothetical protein
MLLTPFIQLLTACSGTVSLSEVDPFGSVTATWVHRESGDQILLSNVSDTCSKLADYDSAVGRLQRFSGSITTPGADYCTEAKEITFAWAEAAGALYYDGARHLTLSVDDEGRSEPDDDTYEVEGDPSLAGYLVYYEASRWEAILEEWDETAAYSDEDMCGVDMDERFDTWLLSEGSLELTSVTDAAASGTLAGELTHVDGDDAGEIQATFTAHHCEIESVR